MFVSLFGKVGAALFGKDGAALLQRDAPVTIEFRFEITRSLLKERFGLPYEMLTRSGTRNEFLCRTLPMARRVGAVAPVPAASVERPHVLFVDAGAAQGQSDVLDEHVLKPAGFPPLQATAEQQFGALDAFAQAGHCTVERWNVAAFRRDYPENAEGTTFLEALRHRLQEPRPGHQQVDILHFSGHGVTPRSSETRLVVPGAKDKTVELLRIGRLAGWLPKSVRLVFLGACQSISASTAEHLHGALRCSVVGFRWEIRAERIPAFAKEFYRAHLADQRSVAAAYRAACHETADDVHTVWASAVALTAD
jgi:hypothetical protein